MNNPNLPEDDDEARLLARELADVKRLQAAARVPATPQKPDKQALDARRQAATEFSADDSAPQNSLDAIPVIAADARLEFHRPGLQLRQWQRLKKGAINWELGVDLHGTTRGEAMQAVNRLIRQALEDHVNCLHIVHGKGRDAGDLTIKAELNHWLRRHDDVLAFSSALPEDGGTGAIYVLLRRQR